MGLQKITNKLEMLAENKIIKVIKIILWVIQSGFGLFGLLIAFGMFLAFDTMSMIAACVTVLSALIILPIMDFIKPIRKYSMTLLLPRAMISFMVLIAAFMIFPETSPFNDSNKVESSITQETTTTTLATTLTTTETTTTTSKTMTTTTSTTTKTTTKPTTTTSMTTTTTTAKTEPPTKPTEEPTKPTPTSPPPTSPPAPVEVTYDFVLNTSTMKAHKPSCRDVKKIDEGNRRDYPGTVEEVQAMGYSPCGHCHPW